MRPDEFDKIRAFEKSHWWYLGRRRLLELMLDHLALSDATILDAGCGTGYAGEHLRRAGTVFGLDAAPEAFCSVSPLNCVARIEATPFGADTFDLIVALDLIEHLDDDLSALREMHRICKPGGHVFITVPAYRWLWSEHDEALGHRRRYTASQLRSRLRRAGFSVDRTSYFVSSVLPAAAAFRLLKRLRKSGGETSTDLFSVPAPLNSALAALMRAEAALSWRAALPFGLTLFALARKERR